MLVGQCAIYLDDARHHFELEIKVIVLIHETSNTAVLHDLLNTLSPSLRRAVQFVLQEIQDDLLSMLHVRPHDRYLVVIELLSQQMLDLQRSRSGWVVNGFDGANMEVYRTPTQRT